MVSKRMTAIFLAGMMVVSLTGCAVGEEIFGSADSDTAADTEDVALVCDPLSITAEDTSDSDTVSADVASDTGSVSGTADTVTDSSSIQAADSSSDQAADSGSAQATDSSSAQAADSSSTSAADSSSTSAADSSSTSAADSSSASATDSSSVSVAAEAGEVSDAGTSDATQAVSADSDLTFESITVVDNDACSIMITDMDMEEDHVLTVEMENKSEDTVYCYDLDELAVNGVVLSQYFYETVSAGKKAIAEIELDEDVLEMAGIEQCTDIELTFEVYDDDDWYADDVAYETVHIYPYGEENAVLYEREANTDDIVLVDNEDVYMSVTGFECDEDWGFYLNVYVENKTDSEIMFTVDDVSVNGYMCEPYWACAVSGGKRAFSYIYWDEYDLAGIGISDFTTIEEIEFLLEVYDRSDYTDLVNEVLTVGL